MTVFKKLDLEHHDLNVLDDLKTGVSQDRRQQFFFKMFPKTYSEYPFTLLIKKILCWDFFPKICKILHNLNSYQFPFICAWKRVHICRSCPIISTFSGSAFLPPGSPVHPRGRIEVAVRITGGSTISPSSTESVAVRPINSCRCENCGNCSMPVKMGAFAHMHESYILQKETTLVVVHLFNETD
jgi:hypothetical protein